MILISYNSMIEFEIPFNKNEVKHQIEESFKLIFSKSIKSIKMHSIICLVFLGLEFFVELTIVSISILTLSLA